MNDEYLKIAIKNLKRLEEHIIFCLNPSNKGKPGYTRCEKVIIDGISFYMEHYDNIKKVSPSDYLADIGCTLITGWIIMNKEALIHIADTIGRRDLNIDEIFRFYLHHEYGHVRDILNGEIINPDELDKNKLIAWEESNDTADKEKEIIADKYSINDLNLDFPNYDICRAIAEKFIEKYGRKISTNYQYDRKKVWNTRHDLKGF